MAVNKVVPKAAKAHGGMRNQIEYVLKDEKVREGYVEITGPFNYDSVNWDTVYNAFLEEKRLWDKDSGRMCAHNIISFHKDENVSPAEVLEIGEAYAERFFPDHQNLIVVHQDKDHLHCHIITNTVSFIDGHKLHQNKRDLERQKAFTNELCREKGLSVTEKGRHFDGSLIEEGHVISWNKNKYQALLHDNGHTEKSYLIDCASAVLEAKETSMSKEEFIGCMERAGWKTTWTDKWEKTLQKEQRKQKMTVRKMAEQELINKEKEISMRIVKEWYSSALLIGYAVMMTIYFVITHWDTFLTGEIFFIRLIGVVKGIWTVAWPAVYGYWDKQFHSDTASLIATIVVAVLAAGAVFGLILLFRKWKQKVDCTFKENDRKKRETMVLITLASMVFSLILCSGTDISMTWIMLWIFVAGGFNFAYLTIHMIWISKHKPRQTL